MFKQKTLTRLSKTIDEGTMGFSDYVTKKESIDDFVQRVIDTINEINEHSTIFNISYPNEDLVIITYIVSVKNDFDVKEPCYMCNNALVDNDLSYDTDMSACSIGKCIDSKLRLMLCSGNRKPTRIELESWTELYGWRKIGEYQPNFCPNCGRKLIEYNN